MNNTIDISIVIPAYNESSRIPLFLEKIIAFCKGQERKYEIVVVDDGSSDGTLEIVESYRNLYPEIQTVQITRNRGKGYAVKRGVFKAKGEICVYLDADGSVEPEEIERNINYILNEGYDIFIGSRVLKNEGQVLYTKRHRKFLGIIFNFIVSLLLCKDFQDTQCGFKMFRKEIIKPLFSRQQIYGFGFDTEILYLAWKMGYKVKEGPVSWKHIKGSKLNLFLDPLRMFLNILQIKIWHTGPINTCAKYMGREEYQYMHEIENYHWWFIGHRELAVRLIKSLCYPEPVILDVGTGTGANLSRFRKLGECYGIDVSEKAAAFCRKIGLRNIALCPAENLAFPDKTFDVILCLEVLEHTPDPIEILIEMKRVLKDNGKIILTVPAFQGLWSQHDEALCHLRRYSRYSLLCDIQEARMYPERMAYLFFTTFFIVAAIRIIKKMLAGRKKFSSDTATKPLRFVNSALKLTSRIETGISLKVGLPVGTTLYTVIHK